MKTTTAAGGRYAVRVEWWTPRRIVVRQFRFEADTATQADEARDLLLARDRNQLAAEAGLTRDEHPFGRFVSSPVADKEMGE